MMLQEKPGNFIGNQALFCFPRKYRVAGEISVPVMEMMTATMMTMLVCTSLPVSLSTSEQATSTSPTLSLKHLEKLRHINCIIKRMEFGGHWVFYTIFSTCWRKPCLQCFQNYFSSPRMTQSVSHRSQVWKFSRWNSWLAGREDEQTQHFWKWIRSQHGVYRTYQGRTKTWCWYWELSLHHQGKSRGRNRSRR